jgi:hypothetical protein
MPFSDSQSPKLGPLLALSLVVNPVQESLGFAPTGVGSICYRAYDEGDFREVEFDASDRLERNGDMAHIEFVNDPYGFSWLVIHQPSDRFKSLIRDLYTTAAVFIDSHFGWTLLCSIAGFQDIDGCSLALVYLYKRGTFYPFAPRSSRTRDNDLELRVKELLHERLPIEPELKRWFAVWEAPGL